MCHIERSGFVPDHKCLKITWKSKANPRRPHYWKPNINVLEKNEYIEEIVTNLEINMINELQREREQVKLSWMKFQWIRLEDIT